MLYIVTEYAENGEMFGESKENLLITYKSVFFRLFMSLLFMLATNTDIIFLFQRLSYLSWSSKWSRIS